jgi:tetratricopeptide (TPR) repeat protein
MGLFKRQMLPSLSLRVGSSVTVQRVSNGNFQLWHGLTRSTIASSFEPGGQYAEALDFFDRFLQHSDLDSAGKCLEILEALLAAIAASDALPSSDVFNCSQSDSSDDTRFTGPSRHHILIHMARTLSERYVYSELQSDLIASMVYGREALDTCRAQDMICPTVWVFLSNVIHIHVYFTCDHDALQMAQLLCQEAMPWCPVGHPLCATANFTLGFVTFRLFEVTKIVSYIDDAIILQELALTQLLPCQRHYEHRHLRALSRYLNARSVYSANSLDTKQAIHAAKRAVEICPSTHVDCLAVVQSMLMGLYLHYLHFGVLADLDQAIKLGRHTLLASHRPRGAARSCVLSVMGNILLARHKTVSSSEGDIDELVSLCREALQTYPTARYRFLKLGSLADALTLQFGAAGDIGNLEEAVDFYRQAINDSSQHPEKVTYIPSLSLLLALRFKESGDISDLNESLSLDQNALAVTSNSHSNYPRVVGQTVSHLCLRFEICGTPADLEDAISISQDLLISLPDDHIDRVDVVHGLSKAFLLRGRRKGDVEDIDKAIDYLTILKRQMNSTYVFGPEYLRTLALAHLTRFRRNRNISDATSCLDIMRGLVQLVGPGHCDRFQCLLFTAEVYMELDTPYHSLDLALKYFTDALHSRGDMRSRIKGARDLLGIVESKHQDIFLETPPIQQELLQVYMSATALLPHIAFFGLHLHSRLELLAEGQSIALTGASHALNLSLPERALEILEQGRAVFWTHALRLRSPFDDVPEVFRGQLMTLARLLEKVSDVAQTTQDPQVIEKEAARRRRKSKEFNMLLEQVRRLPGLERFLLHDEFSTLKKVAAKGPVMILVSSKLACHAIILKPCADAVTIRLGSLTEMWLVNSGSVWRSAQIDARSTATEDRKLVKAKNNSESSQDILRQLWFNIVWPVLNILQVAVGLSVHMLSMHMDSPICISLRMAVIGPASGGVRQDRSPIFRSTLLVLMANVVRTTLYRPTYQHSAH